jgi:alditol oxidase
MPEQNWARNLTYAAARIHRPESIEELQEIVRRSRRLRALGSRHSFNTIADTPGDLVSLERLRRIVLIDRERRTVTVEGGVRYGELGQQLEREGLALHNMASLPHITVAGACATATHGSGDRNGNLATAVSAIEIVAADGERVALSRERDGERFQGAVVALGALGVVSQITLDIQPSFRMRQDVYEGLPLAELERSFDAIMGGAYSVSLFSDWQSERVNQVWLKRVVTPETDPALAPELYGASLAPTHRHPIAEIVNESWTAQMGIPGPWNERLPHFRMDHTPSNGDELQSEYFVPRAHALDAIRAVRGLRAQLAGLLMISEVRSIAADALWMSPCYQQDCVGLHFTWHQNWPGVRELLPQLEAALAPYGARPHWGKCFTMPAPEVRALYPRLDDFRALLGSYDPEGKLRNDFVATYV